MRKSKSIFYYLVNLNALIQTLIIIVQYFATKKSQSVNSSFMHLFRVICNSTGAVLQLQILINPNSIKIFVNSLFYYTINFSGRYKLPQKVQKGLKLDILLKVLYRFAFFYSVLIPIAIFKNPTSPRYSYSLFYKLCKNRLFTPCFVLMEILYALFSWHIILFNIFIFLAYIFATLRLLEAALVGEIQRRGCESEEKLRASELFKIYRSMQILNNELLTVMSPVSLPTVKLACIGIPITLNFMSIRLQDAVPGAGYMVILVFSSIGMIFTLSCWPTAASVNSLSVKLIGKYGFSKREKNTLWPLRVRFSCFNLTRFTSIKVFGFVVYWTMKILLLFPS
ncbi:unnamed protein product [Allacma fusca]|uniref:Uncharacterized protein n=1 Tax=Allacma fusca TaxID=39272 RepID=A0A8J2P041_9HEXA|nr:unnamed protein product [Allacma fusca]